MALEIPVLSAMHRPVMRLLQGAADQIHDLLIAHLARSSRACRIIQLLDSVPGKTPSPLVDGHRRYADALSDDPAKIAVRKRRSLGTRSQPSSPKLSDRTPLGSPIPDTPDDRRRATTNGHLFRILDHVSNG